MQPNLGEAAETVHRVLYHNGPVSLRWMYMASGLPVDVANRGIGWLAREGKLLLEKRTHGRELRVEKAVVDIWKILRSRGPMSVGRIRDLEGLPADMVHQSLGWLAREGRLTVAGAGGEQVLQIGEVAGSIWRTLHSWGPMSKRAALAATNLPENMADLGIGWLAREGKLVLEDRSSRRDAPFQEVAGSVQRVTHSDWPVFKRHLYQALGFLVDTTGRRNGGRTTPNGMLFLEQGGTSRQVQAGEAAGAVWDVLHSSGLTFRRDLCAATNLPDEAVDQGIGWLAREDKLVLGMNRKGHEWFRLKK